MKLKFTALIMVALLFSIFTIGNSNEVKAAAPICSKTGTRVVTNRFTEGSQRVLLNMNCQDTKYSKNKYNYFSNFQRPVVNSTLYSLVSYKVVNKIEKSRGKKSSYKLSITVKNKKTGKNTTKNYIFYAPINN